MDLHEFRENLRSLNDVAFGELRQIVRSENQARIRAKAASFRVGEVVQFDTNKGGKSRFEGQITWEGRIKSIGPKNVVIEAKPLEGGKVVQWRVTATCLRRPGEAKSDPAEYEPV